METTPTAARVLAAPCHPTNPYSGWYGSAHQMAHGASQSSLLPFPGAHATPSHVMATNQASSPMYNLHNQYHQYHTVGSTSTGTPPAMSMTHGFIGNPHHHSAFGHPAASGDHGGQIGSMGGPFSAPFFLNVDRSNAERKCK